MTSDLLSSASGSQAKQQEPQKDSRQADVKDSGSRLLEAMKSVYQADQQAKFLDLHAEADSLLRQLQSLKQQRTSHAASLAGAERR